MIKTGDKYRHEVTYTQEGVIAFAEITGDKTRSTSIRNSQPKPRSAVPSCTDSFRPPYSRRSSECSSRTGHHLSPQEMSFRAPVFAGEKYTAEFEVIDVNTEKHIGTIKCLLLDAAGKECITGTAKLKHNKEFI